MNVHLRVPKEHAQHSKILDPGFVAFPASPLILRWGSKVGRAYEQDHLDQLETIRSSINEISQVKQLVRDNAEYTKKAIAEKYQ